MMLLWWTAGCRWPCPPDAIRLAGRCQLIIAGAGLGEPLTEAEFLDRYERELCDALEDCACEEFDSGDCEVDVDCPDVDWPQGCTFDGDAARECATGHFSCDDGGDGFEIEPPSACDAVYTCGTTGDTATR